MNIRAFVPLVPLVLAVPASAQLFSHVQMATTNPNWFFQEFIPSTTIRTGRVVIGNSTFNPGSAIDTTGLDAAYQTWWFYRGDGDPREYGLSFFESGANTGAASRYRFIEPSAGGGNVFEFTFDYRLVGLDADRSFVRIDWTAKNRTAQARTLRFFSWNDLQIGFFTNANTVVRDGTAFTFTDLDDTAEIVLNTGGRHPASFESGLASGLRDRLMDSGPIQLAGTVDGELRDHAVALQYTLALAAGETQGGTVFRAYNCVPRLIQGTATLADWSGAVEGRPIVVTLHAPGQSAASETHFATLRADGGFDFATTLGGAYDVRVKARGRLSDVETAVALPVQGASGLAFTLEGGDIDDDNQVTVFDYDKLSAYFDATDADAGWTTPDADGIAPRDADIDGDGSVTVFDYDILSTNFDRAGA